MGQKAALILNRGHSVAHSLSCADITPKGAQVILVWNLLLNFIWITITLVYEHGQSQSSCSLN